MQSRLITAPDAAKLPRLGLLALCVLYVLPGLLGRDPWSIDDATGFGIAFTMAAGDAGDWLRPNVAGLPVFDKGPLAYWIGAAFVRLLPFVPANLAVRLAAGAWLFAALVAMWYALYALASRPESQPSDPFGASPSRTDFGRAVADAGLLILLATFGPIARLHETTPDALQVALSALFLFGAARAPQAPRTGGALAGLAAGASVMAAGVPTAAALLVAGAVLPVLSHPHRLVMRSYLAWLLATAAMAGGAWPALLAASGPEGVEHLRRWLTAGVRALASTNRAAALGALVQTLSWFFWPAWPIAAWALYAWRGRLAEPAVAVPLMALAATGVVMLAGAQALPNALLPAAPAFAMLAGIGLPSLSRRVLSLIDWFAVAAFTVFALGMWAYWLAWLAGAPPRMAASIVRLAPGLPAHVSPLGTLFALAATLGWLALARWRVARHPRALWRSVVLSAGGLVLAWSLLMSLWLPVFNHRKSHRDVAQQAAAVMPADHGCVVAEGLAPAPRAAFAYFAGFRFARSPGQAADCQWLLIGDRAGARTPEPSPAQWTTAWEGRRAADRSERYRLYRRAP